MKVRIDHLDANPFRNIDRYPIREDKIAALVESINTTGFWDNLVGRQVGDRVQIAYGHHRREALRRAHPADTEIDIVVRDFNDETMLQIMARENQEEWGTSAWIEMETVSSVVEAYGAGQIRLEKPDTLARAAQLRFAPSFAMGDTSRSRGAYPYSAVTVARFLGWVKPNGDPQDKVKTALAALELIEAGELHENDFTGLGTKAAEALVTETRRAVQQRRREAEEAQRRAAELERQRREAAERAEQAARNRAEALERARMESRGAAVSRRRGRLGDVSGSLVELVCTDDGVHEVKVLGEVHVVEGIVTETAESKQRRHVELLAAAPGQTVVWRFECPRCARPYPVPHAVLVEQLASIVTAGCSRLDLSTGIDC